MPETSLEQVAERKESIEGAVTEIVELEKEARGIA